MAARAWRLIQRGWSSATSITTDSWPAGSLSSARRARRKRTADCSGSA
ncbi:hypothetical protein [Synechococcus sp. RSCCF101]|nr:hypothetical protein [Synechococcus sp. RSCCF101]